MNTKFYPQWLRLTAGLLLLLAALAPASPAYADSCLVTTHAESGAGSLREKIANPACDTITFDGNYTIALDSPLTVNSNVTIDGVGHSITISGRHAVRVFVINPGATLSLNYLTVANGDANTVLGQNWSDPDGGGIYNWGTLIVTNSIFSGNRAAYGWGHGGAIFNDAGTVTLMDTTVYNNDAFFGGGIYNWSGTLNVTNSNISGNYSAGGGGILNVDGPMTVMNSTFSDNWEGAITNAHGTAAVTNSTISGNHDGGLITDAGTMTVMNTVVANNLVNNIEGNCFIQYQGIITGSNNLTDDDTCGSSFVNSSSILLGQLADNGGPTQTMALLPGSAAIDAGDDAACPATDQRGVARPKGAHCDIGAYEAEINTGHGMYNFTGFASPVDNPPFLNTAKAGQTIPLKWRITDADGNPVTDLTGVTVTAVSLDCPSAPSTDAIEEYVASSSGLQNLGDGYYQWNWKSAIGYSNSCKTLKLDLGEGAGFEHVALFQFRK